MKRFHALPSVDRPREKLLRYGPAKLSNAELLALLLRTGTQQHDVLALSRIVLRKFPSVHLTKASVMKLQEVSGLGAAKSCEIVACMELGRRLLLGKEASLLLTPKDVHKRLQDIASSRREHFVVFYLDARSQEIRRDTVSIGTLTENIVHPREVFEQAIMHTAAQVLVAHNHPSGTLVPSQEDLALTNRLVSAGKILGVKVLDHVIVTQRAYYSFRENNLL